MSSLMSSKSRACTFRLCGARPEVQKILGLLTSHPVPMHPDEEEAMLGFASEQEDTRWPRCGKPLVLVADADQDCHRRLRAKLRAAGWEGYWIDAASTLRMKDHTVIILDPVNRAVIDSALERGVKDYIGGNCTVSLMLMATQGLFEAGWVEWISSMTYQSASGAGAKNMRELVAQMRFLGDSSKAQLDDPDSNILDIGRAVTAALHAPEFPAQEFGVPLAASLIPWIDRAVDAGQTREEWKGYVEDIGGGVVELSFAALAEETHLGHELAHILGPGA